MNPSPALLTKESIKDSDRPNELPLPPVFAIPYEAVSARSANTLSNSPADADASDGPDPVSGSVGKDLIVNVKRDSGLVYTMRLTDWLNSPASALQETCETIAGGTLQDRFCSEAPETRSAVVKSLLTDVATIPEAPALITRVRDFSKLNRSDFAELNRHHFLLGQRQKRHLKAVKDKRELFPKRFRHPDYLPHSAMLLLSNGWQSAERYACCCIVNPGNPSGACKLHKFCPYCCWHVRERAALAFVPAFDSGTWHFLTGSFVGDLTLNSGRVAAETDQLLHYWDAYKTGFQKWIDTKAVRGLYWVDELAVNSLLPTKVLPHVHAIVHADSIEDTDILKLQRSVNRYLRAKLGREHLQPDIQVKNINSARNLLDHVNYLHKPINLLKAYEMAWPRASFHNRHLAPELNSQVSDLVLGYTMITTDRRKMTSKGSLDSKTRDFIGIPKFERDAHRATLTEIRAEAHDEYIELGVEPEVEEVLA